MGCHFLLQGIFPTQGSNPCLLHCRRFFTHRDTWEAPYRRSLIKIFMSWASTAQCSIQESSQAQEPCASGTLQKYFYFIWLPIRHCRIMQHHMFKSYLCGQKSIREIFEGSFSVWRNRTVMSNQLKYIYLIACTFEATRNCHLKRQK